MQDGLIRPWDRKAPREASGAQTVEKRERKHATIVGGKADVVYSGWGEENDYFLPANNEMGNNIQFLRWRGVPLPLGGVLEWRGTTWGMLSVLQ